MNFGTLHAPGSVRNFMIAGGGGGPKRLAGSVRRHRRRGGRQVRQVAVPSRLGIDLGTGVDVGPGTGCDGRMSSAGIVEGYGPPPGAAVRWAEPKSDQLDFWCGTWRAETVGGDVPDLAPARNEVGWQWGGAVLLEDFSLPTDEGAFHGRSWSVPVPGRGWCQTWVDSDGQYLDFVGGLVGDELVMDRVSEPRRGERVHQRMLWWDIGPDAFSWAWLSAAEGAREWSLRWELRYTRA